MAKSSNGNVRMVITEEKILANIEKVKKMINPNSKKRIVKLEEDSYFLDLIASIKSYLEEYPKQDVFPRDVYDAAYDLVEYATTQFEENTKKIEELIRQRESNIALASELKEVLKAVEAKETNWKKKVQDLSEKLPEDVIDTLGVIGRAKSKKTQTYLDSLNLINTKVSNLESNLFIEVDMERIEDKSKALSYIGIEIAESLKDIENVEEVKNSNKENEESYVQHNAENQENTEYIEDTRVEVKPSLWERIKNMKLVRGIRYIMKIKVVLELPEMPESRKARYISELHLSEKDSNVCNWLNSDIARILNEKEIEPEQIPFTAEQLAELVELIDAGTISSSIGKKVLDELFENPRSPKDIIKEKGWIQISDENAIKDVVLQVLSANTQSIADFKAGKDRALGFLVGQAMKATKGIIYRCL